MQTIHSIWKVESTHKMGYQAPTYYVETSYEAVSSRSKHENLERERKVAVELAKSRSRFTDYPETWTITVTKVHSNES